VANRGLRWDEEEFTKHQARLADAAAVPSTAKTISNHQRHIQHSESNKKVDRLASFHALGRLPKGEMNKTESAYARHLDQLKLANEILEYRFHPFNVRLGKNAFYEVDFLVLPVDLVLEIHETKGGYTTDKGQMKIRLCADALPFFRFKKAIKRSAKQGGGWLIEDFSV
jgi:hypothetical protein